MIEKRTLPSGKVTYRVRYRDSANKQRSKSFKLRRDAESFESERRSRKQRGDWVEPKDSKILVSDFWDEFLSAQVHLRAKTRERYKTTWARRIKPHWASRRLGAIDREDIVAWVAEMCDTDPSATVRHTVVVFNRMLDHAVKNRRIRLNPYQSITLPPLPPPRERILTAEDVFRLADALPQDRQVVLGLTFLGLRWSELAGLRVRNVDFATKRVYVNERVTEVKGQLDFDVPKSKASIRYVPIPKLMVPILKNLVAGKLPNDHVFTTPTGEVLRVGNWRRRIKWNTTVAELGLEGITPHDLRRTYGSLARKAGADLRYIQKTMGHSSITVTARVYAHLYDDELDTVADALDDIAASVTRNKECGQNVATEAISHPKPERKQAHGNHVHAGQRESRSWSRLGESNPGPTHYECVALPTELRRRGRKPTHEHIAHAPAADRLR